MIMQCVGLLIIYSILVFRWAAIGQERESNKTYLVYHTQQTLLDIQCQALICIFIPTVLCWRDPPLHICIYAA